MPIGVTAGLRSLFFKYLLPSDPLDSGRVDTSARPVFRSDQAFGLADRLLSASSLLLHHVSWIGGIRK